MRKFLALVLLFTTGAHAQQSAARYINFNAGWQLLALENNSSGKEDASVKRDQSFKSQFDEQYIKNTKDKAEEILQKEKDEAVKGFSIEFPMLKNKQWKNVSLPCPVRYEPQLNPGPQSFQGISYYRKTFVIPKSLAGKELSLLFEGAMHTASIWINGQFVMQHRGGYTPFYMPLKNLVNYGTANEIIIRLDNRDDAFTPPGKPLNRNGFLYWSGIYRDVWLVSRNTVYITDPVEANKVAGGGVFIRTENVDKQSADVLVQTHVRNSGSAPARNVRVVHVIKNQKGKIVGEISSRAFHLNPLEDSSINQKYTVNAPVLWSPDAPGLYSIVTEIRQGNKVWDRVEEKFGIRHLYFSRQEGFKLNGNRLRIAGTNLHQDYPFIGNAVSNESHLRDLIKIKNAGFNFVRLPHYPHDPSVYAYCDSLGLMVADCIPGWQFFNSNELFKERVFRDIRDMIRRDRNHPSVIMWEASLNESLPPAEFRKQSVRVAKAEYPGDQMVVAGDISGGADSTWDVAYNHWKEPFGRPQDVQPNTPGFVREYGDYEFGGGKSTTRKNRSDEQAALLQNAWNLQWEHNVLRGPQYFPWTVGDANWAFYDGGEGWTTKMSDWGVADIYHIPKFSYYFYRSQSSPSAIGPMVYIADWWNRRDTAAKVIVYSNCEEVALYLNGKLVAKQKPDNGPDTDYGNFTEGGNAFDGGNARNLDHPPYTFRNVTWQPGALKAVGYMKGQEIVTTTIRNAGATEKLEMSADTKGVQLKADNADAVFVHAAVTDKNGTIVTLDSTTVVSFSVAGNGVIVSPATVKVRAGIASVLLRTTAKAGEIRIIATADKLHAGTIILKSK